MSVRLTNLSIRTHLTLLVLVAFLPAVAIISYTAVKEHRQAVVEGERRAALLLDLLRESQLRLAAETRQMLGTLAELPEVQNRDAATCNRLFASLLSRYPHYNSIQAAGSDGRVFASGRPLVAPHSIVDRRYFRDAIRTRTFSPGEYIVGRTIGKPMLNFGQPVFAPDGRVVAVLQAGVDLEFLNRLFAETPLPAGASVVITDHAGTILYRSVQKGGLGLPDDPGLFRLMRAGKEPGRLSTGAGLSFAPLTVFTPVRLAPGTDPYLYIRAVMAEELVYGAAVRNSLRNLLLMLSIVIGTLILARKLGKRGIAEPIERLVQVSRRLAGGDLKVRTELTGSRSEMGELARAFDDMARALGEREAERDRALDDLSQLTQRAVAERARSEAVIAAIGDGISIQGTDFRIIYQNEQHRALVGEREGRPCHEVYGAESAVCDLCPMVSGFGDRRIHTMERTVRKEDGVLLHLEITATPIRDYDGVIVGAVEAVRDITRRKEMEEQLQRGNDALSRSNRELQHFAYVASHDLREPLRTITSFIQLLQRRYAEKLDRNADEFIGFIVDGAGRMQQLIDDLLLYSRVESRGKEFAPTDTAAACRHALANLNAAIDESGAYVTASPLPTVQGDQVQLVQLFQNLIGNAIKFRGPSPPEIRVSCERDGDSWRFSVSDNGIGIPPESYERIFDIFQKLHPRDRYEGTGIGLAICKKIVERHGGWIWVESTPGSGSTFFFTLGGGAS